MKGIHRFSDYDDFAWVYNRHWGMQFTPTSLAVLDKYVLTGLPPGAVVLDLCCGTGQLAGILSGRGFNVTGIDGSVEMLNYARENAPGASFIHEDARSFSLPVQFDLAVSFFDSLNHVMTLDELAAVFRNVYACLKGGGVFLFDMNLEPGYLKNWHGLHGIIEDDHVCVFPNSYDEEQRTARFEAIIFRLINGQWYRFEVRLAQKCYTIVEVTLALEEAGFSEIDAFGFTRQAGRQELTRDSDRVFFLCGK